MLEYLSNYAFIYMSVLSPSAYIEYSEGIDASRHAQSVMGPECSNNHKGSEHVYEYIYEYIYIYNTVIHRIWAVLQSDWLNYSPYVSSYTASIAKNKMAVQKLHEFCEAEKKKIFALRKIIIVQGKTLKKIWQVSKIYLLHRN
jgi:hypothetical protein